MLDVGAVVDRYEVLSVLGQGGMAVVYRVRHTELGSLHAMKLLIAIRPDQQERLLQEGRIQARLHHPNLVRVHDVLRVDGRPALVMEYVDGPALDRYMADQRPSIEVIERIFRGICAGVGHAHQNGMIHRDLKPANILLHVVDGVPIPKVTDFGIAKVLEHGDAGATSAGTAMGTPRYMAPEQIRDAKGVDARADIYALGSMLYELVSARPLTESTDIVAIYEQAMREELPELPSSVPDRIVHAVHNALRGNRNRRIPDVAGLLRVLDGAAFDPDVAAETLVPGGDATVDFGVALPTSPIATAHPGGPNTWHTQDDPGAAITERVSADSTGAESIGAWSVTSNIDAYGPTARFQVVHPDGRTGIAKTLRGDAGRKPIELLKREARVLRQIHDPAVPALLDEFAIGEGDARRLVIVREDPGGEPLAQFLDQHRFTREEAIARSADLLAIVARLHRLTPPIVHREITPDHIWVTPGHTWKIADFGSVRDEAPDAELGGQTFVGAWGYMAPEQFGGDAHPATDVYGVGALLVHLLSRRAPKTLLDRDGRIAYKTVYNDQALEPALDAMLAADPAARPTAREAEAALRSLLPRPIPRPARDPARDPEPALAREPARAPEPELAPRLAPAPEPERPIPDGDPLHRPPILAPPPALPVAPPPALPVAPPPIGLFSREIKLAATTLLFLLAMIAIAGGVLVAARPDTPPAPPTPTPISLVTAIADTALPLAHADPDVQRCVADYRAAHPTDLAQRVDLEYVFDGRGPPTTQVIPGPFINDPVFPCLIAAVAAIDWSSVPRPAHQVTVHDHLDLGGP